MTNIISDSDNDSSNGNLENNEDNFFDDEVDAKVPSTPKPTLNTKVVRAMKKLQG